MTFLHYQKSKVIFTLLLSCISIFTVAQNRKIVVRGRVKDADNQEDVIGASIYDINTKKGTTSNVDGVFTLNLIDGYHELKVKCTGFKEHSLFINVERDTVIDLLLEKSVTELDVIEVKANINDKITDVPQMSKVEIPIEQLDNLPLFLGEKDVIKAFQLMPGVQKNGDGNGDFFVRGGSGDQNLMLLDGVTIYNGQHLGGLFSVFSGDILETAAVYKGGFPAKYGGRLSSVLAMKTRDGDYENIHGKFHLGVLSSSVLVELPLKKEKLSLIFSARRSFTDFLFKFLSTENTKSKLLFYDSNLKLTYKLNNKNSFSFSTFLGKDIYSQTTLLESIPKKINENTINEMNWRNYTNNLRWKHFFSNHLIGKTSLIYNKYKFQSEYKNQLTNATSNQKTEFNFISSIEDLGIKYELDFNLNSEHSFTLGTTVTYHKFTPKNINHFQQVNSDTFQDEVRTEINTEEYSFYLQHLWIPNDKWRFQYGVRWSVYNNKVTYNDLEPRLNIAYKLTENLTLKSAYSRMNQYIIRLQGAEIGEDMQSSLYAPVNDKILPQRSDQISLGIAKDFSKSKGITLSVEGYYKKLDDITLLKEGEPILDFDFNSLKTTYNEKKWDEMITSGKGTAYGAEFLLQKKTGKFSGWLGYTLSWAKLDFDNLNNGKSFYAPWDRRHNFTLTTIYQPQKKVTLSSVFTYTTGAVYTMPIGKVNINGFYGNGNDVDILGNRSNFRGDAYHRLDLSAQFHKFKKGNQKRTWSFGVYNTYARNNAFTYTLTVNQENKAEVTKTGLFTILPYVAYSFEF
ncbi:TonB-dependent receptor [Flammeovirga kamogawensis]|uniref:TonB-dependent receptor n=1 Tax=Flammeovirga kamogawensis TaxID=373891 RepID=A0ABX8H1K1_9BACT|nr:TonB-dependent receptor [Flammeovirga kamogawensis]MBB6462304.1 hypothetical protein [Flammeovirga kamogawensis]QWG09306.1 TonB-dependent receptor [Flammeovirga kamogawensis]TRX64828.1 TonB-dependent receptor [Flammeovirga kamogawensis]